MSLEETISRLSQRLLELSTGDLAQLRRMDIHGAGPLSFWRLAAECGLLDFSAPCWMRIVQILALLTPKGDREDNDALHDPKRPFGAALCDGGDPDWPQPGAEPRPFLSEARLARLLSAPASQRGDALTRCARMLAASRPREQGFNCTQIAELLRYPADESNLHRLARAYYQRLDSAKRKAEHEEAQT